jgi:hypothetical protein
MDTGKAFFSVMVLAAASCQSASMLEFEFLAAKPVAYADIKKASGVLGYAEALLGPTVATTYNASVGPGSSLVDPATVAGAWELPTATKVEDSIQSLRAHGTVDRIRDYRGGQIWIADYRRAGQPPVRLMLIDGNNPTFQTSAVPEVRPGPHVYLIAYRQP